MLTRPNLPTALLVHGLGRTPASMFPLAATIRRAGVRPLFFGYSCTFEAFDRIVRRLKGALTERRPDFLIAHSLGGILLRFALAEIPPWPVRHFVMLGTPNQPPRLARYFWKWLPFRLLARSCGRFLAHADGYARLRPITIPHTVIAGTAGPTGRLSPFGNEPNDGIVSVGETRVDATHEPVLVPAWHTRMMAHPTVHATVARLLTSSSLSG
jgi:hypothetical protein